MCMINFNLKNILSFFLSCFHPSIPREDTPNWRGWKRINGWGMWLGLGFEGRILAGFLREEHAPYARASPIYLHGRGGAAQWICMVCLKRCSCTRQKSWTIAGSCRWCFCNIFLLDDLVQVCWSWIENRCSCLLHVCFGDDRIVKLW
jgi:hypothetical protein